MPRQVVDVLRAIESPGAFSVRVTAPAGDLRIEVKDVGPIRLPVSSPMARKLIGAARPAPFGRGERTVRDPQVRDTWEIARTRVKVDQRLWRQTLEPQLERIKAGLGVAQDCRLEARLHKLLVYEPGQFFRVHQDSEKSDDMVGTLSVVLPSTYTGGAEVIEHRGEKVTYRRTARSGKALTFIAFYADCHHEIRPIKSGYRVVLVYNLSVRRAKGAVKDPIDESAVDDLAASVGYHFDTAVREYSWREPARPEKLVYLLDHDYTQRGIGWHRLKGADARRVAALRAAARRLDCEALLGLADIQEIWDCLEESGPWGYRGYHRTAYDYEVDEGGDEDDEDPVAWHGNVPGRARGYRHSDLILNELIESGVELHDLLDESGEPAGLSPLGVDTTELCFTRANDDAEPFRSEYEPYMGNYGNTLDRWYRRAAVVLWPRERAFSIRGRGHPSWAIGEIARCLSGKALEEARGLVRTLLPVWGRAAAAHGAKQLLSRTIKVAGQLADPELAAGLLQPLSPAVLSRTSVSQLAGLTEAYGFTWSRALFEHWYERDRRHGFSGESSGFELLVDACAALHASGGQAGRELAVWLVAEEWALVEKAIEQALKDPGKPHVRRHLAELGAPVARIFRATVAAHAEDQRNALVRYLVTQESRALTPLLVSMLRACREQIAPSELQPLGLEVLLAHCTAALSALAAEPAREPDDWSIDPPMTCDCELCNTLGRFLAARDQTKVEWPLAKERRRHVHGQIDGYELPVSHVTRRVGRPFKLVLAKQKALFTHEAKRRAELERDLAWLRRERRSFG
jgi:hypothetical protein